MEMAEGAGGRPLGFRDQVEFHQIRRRPRRENCRPRRTNVRPHSSRPSWNWKTYWQVGSVKTEQPWCNIYQIAKMTESEKSLSESDSWCSGIWQMGSRSRMTPPVTVQWNSFRRPVVTHREEISYKQRKVWNSDNFCKCFCFTLS